jgi:hypothetical protein
VPTDRAVRVPVEREKLTIRRSRRGHRRVEQTVRKEGEQGFVDQADKQAFPQRAPVLARKDREEVGTLPTHLGPDRVDRPVAKRHIGVAEDQQIAGRDGSELVIRPVLPDPAGWPFVS